MEYFLFLPLFGPGLALVFWLIPEKDFSWFERFILGLGAGLAFYPIILLLFHITGLSTNRAVIYAMLVASFIVLGGRLYPSLNKLPAVWGSLKELKGEVWLSAIFLLIVLILSAYVRIAVVKDLKVPMWADSYHHTMISQLIIDNNGLFSSWLPYAPLKTFTYHFGFHSLVAAYHWLTGLVITRAVIVTGQIVNFLIVLACYLLAKYLTQNRWAGNIAALFVGLISPMPAYYFNWGRYTQLTGLAILPIAIALTLYLLNQPRFNKYLVLITGFVIAGLGLSHYGVLVFYVLFGVIVVCYKLIEIRLSPPRLKIPAVNLLVAAAVAGLITMPWIVNFITGHFMTIITATVTQTQGATPEKIKAHNVIGDITFFLNTHWYILVVIGILWAVWNRHTYTILVSIWAASLLILANPHYLNLPGTGLINNFAVFISLFLPFSVILGYFLADLRAKIRCWHPFAANFVVVILLLLGLWGARFRLSFYDPDRELVTDSDLAAMAWIKENTPEDAKFLINHSYAYNNSTAIGTDAGWWLPLLAQRQNIILPLTFQERPLESNEFSVNRFFRRLDQVDLYGSEGHTLLRETGVTHLYLGQQNGQVWNETGQEPLNRNLLRASDFYRELYHRDDVSVFILSAGEGQAERRIYAD